MQYGQKIGIGDAAYLAGELHDVGKFTAAFQARLAGASAIKKFYHFASGLDVQLFLDAPGLPFVENNGRGTISVGKCEVR